MIGLSVVNIESKSSIGQPVRMLAGGLQRHQIDDVDDANLQMSGKCWRSKSHRGQRFQRGHVAGASHHHVRLAALVVAGPVPDADARRAVLDRGFHVEPLRRGLLAGHDHVDVVAAAQAMVRDREQRVGIGRQIDADDVRLLVHHMIDEAGILVAEPVVILPPDVRSQQIIQRGDRARATECRASTFNHLACWLNMESTMWMNAS